MISSGIMGAVAGSRRRTAGPSYLLAEDFEGPGYENSWTEAGTGTLDDANATAPAPLVGSYSLRLTLSSQNGTTFTTLSADQSPFEAYWIVHFASALPVAGKVFMRIRNVSNVVVAWVEVGAASKITLRCGTGAGTTVGAIAADTTYHFWLRYVKGTGADAVANIAFSTDGIRPTSGDNFKEITNGSATTDANNILIGPENNSTWDGIFDTIRAVGGANTIGDNPA